MLDLICAIPENVGWLLVGALGAYTTVAGWMVCKAIYTAIKERLEERKDNEE